MHLVRYEGLYNEPRDQPKKTLVFAGLNADDAAIVASVKDSLFDNPFKKEKEAAFQGEYR